MVRVPITPTAGAVEGSILYIARRDTQRAIPRHYSAALDTQNAAILPIGKACRGESHS